MPSEGGDFRAILGGACLYDLDDLEGCVFVQHPLSSRALMSLGNDLDINNALEVTVVVTEINNIICFNYYPIFCVLARVHDSRIPERLVIGNR